MVLLTISKPVLVPRLTKKCSQPEYASHTTQEAPLDERRPLADRDDASGYSSTMVTVVFAERPNTSGSYICSARAGGTTKVPGVVARVT